MQRGSMKHWNLEVCERDYEFELPRGWGREGLWSGRIGRILNGNVPLNPEVTGMERRIQVGWEWSSKSKRDGNGTMYPEGWE